MGLPSDYPIITLQLSIMSFPVQKIILVSCEQTLSVILDGAKFFPCFTDCLFLVHPGQGCTHPIEQGSYQTSLER